MNFSHVAFEVVLPRETMLAGPTTPFERAVDELGEMDGVLMAFEVGEAFELSLGRTAWEHAGIDLGLPDQINISRYV